jgi:hypothetical protein
MVLPEFINIYDWASSLIIDFPNDNIPLLLDESNWKAWGNLLIQEERFINNNAPSTDTYEDWNRWAFDVYFVMNNSAN